MFMPFQEGLIIYVILTWGCCLGQYFDIKHCCLLFKALCIYWTKKIFSFKYILNQKEINWKKGGGGAGKWALGVLDPTSQVFLTMKFGLQCLLWEICGDRIDRREAVMAADLYTLSDLSQIARGRLMEIHNSQQTTILIALYWNKLQDSAILRRRQLPNC